MSMKCLTIKDLINRLSADTMPLDERRRADKHIDDCPKCQAALERMGQALAAMIVAWSQKIEGCPTFEEIYDTVFELPGGLLPSSLEKHLAECETCREEYEFIRACPAPETVAPVGHKAPKALVAATIDRLKAVRPEFHPAKPTRTAGVAELITRARDFLETLGREATVVFMELQPATATVRLDDDWEQKVPLEDGRYYFVLSSLQPQVMRVRVRTPGNQILVDTTAQSPGVFELYVGSTDTYSLEVKDEQGAMYEVKLHPVE